MASIGDVFRDPGIWVGRVGSARRGGAGQQQSHEALNADPAPGATSFPGQWILIRS
jgi:hypothetical protein